MADRNKKRGHDRKLTDEIQAESVVLYYENEKGDKYAVIRGEAAQFYLCEKVLHKNWQDHEFACKPMRFYLDVTDDPNKYVTQEHE